MKLTKYDKTISGGNTPDVDVELSISDTYPHNPKSFSKNHDGQAFYKSHNRAIDTLNSIEKSMLEGNAGESEDDW